MSKEGSRPICPSRVVAALAVLSTPLLATSALAAPLPAGPDFRPRLSNEHADIGIGFVGGVWDLHAHDEDNGIEYEADEVLLHVGSAGRATRPGSSAFNFVGAAAGSTIHVLPQSQNSSLLYLGVAAEEVAPQSFDRYNAFAASKGRTPSVAAAYAQVQLLNVTGYNGGAAPGHFSLWQNDAFGQPLVHLSSFDDGVANPDANGLDVTDGISADDAFWLIEGSHQHHNWGFTAPGIYEVTLRAGAYLNTDGNVSTLGNFSWSDPVTFTFGVQTTAVPEPAGIGAVGLLGGLLVRRRRRANSTANA